MEKLYVFNGYELVGECNTLEEAKEICENHCKKFKISFDLKITIPVENNEQILIYQYATLYNEVFFITPKRYKL